METRSLYIHIWQELSAHKPMIFLVGPRQAGKTTLAHLISEAFTNHLYFNTRRTRLPVAFHIALGP